MTDTPNWLSVPAPPISDHLRSDVDEALELRAQYNAIRHVTVKTDTLRSLQWRACHKMSGVQLCRKADRIRLNRIIQRLRHD